MPLNSLHNQLVVHVESSNFSLQTLYFGARNKMIDPMLSWQCLLILFKVAVIYVIVIPSVFMAMPVNMTLVMYVTIYIVI